MPDMPHRTLSQPPEVGKLAGLEAPVKEGFQVDQQDTLQQPSRCNHLLRANMVKKVRAPTLLDHSDAEAPRLTPGSFVQNMKVH